MLSDQIASINNFVILVNEKDQPIGEMGKLEVHKKGLLHRAFSTFIFNDNGQLLLQRRAKVKYHSGNLWTNTCCSHPRPGDYTLEAAKRRRPAKRDYSVAFCNPDYFIFAFKGL